ncbi:MAG TPA: hypothetical protein PKD34_02300 [Candidatus Doudnabacteria bacterium]|nr:hypothetical protein [Candidatus Doudnabacteria bacterium]
MTPAQLILKTLFMQVFLIIIKIIFFGYLNISLLPILIIYYLLLAAAAIALIRRFGPINYFEAFLAMFLWAVISLASDLIITSLIIGREVYSDWHFWLSYAVVLLAMLIFHKKQHVEIRKALK